MRQFIDRIAESFQRWRRFVGHDIWDIGQPGEDVQDSFLAKQVRVAVLLLQKFIGDALTVRAAALAFATSIAIVPVLFLLFMIIQSLSLGSGLYAYLDGELNATIDNMSSRIASVVPGGSDDESTTPEAPEAESQEASDVLLNLGSFRGVIEEARAMAKAADGPPAETETGQTAEALTLFFEALDGALNASDNLETALEIKDPPPDHGPPIDVDALFEAIDASNAAVRDAYTAMIGLGQDNVLDEAQLKELDEELAKLNRARSDLKGSAERFAARHAPEVANRQVLNQLLSTVLGGLDEPYQGNQVNFVKLLADQVESNANNVGAVSMAGLLFLLTTVFGLMRNVEEAFVSIWGAKRERSYWRFFSEYLTVILILPVVSIGVLGLTAALSSESFIDRLGPLAALVQVARFVLVWLAFAFVFAVVPGAKVKFRYALVGGIVAGTAWVLTSMAYVEFQISMANYSLFWSTWAQFPLLLMWIYVSWIIVLFGAELTYAYQHEKTFAMERWSAMASYGYREALGLRAMLELAWRFERGLPPLQPQQCAEEWNVPLRLLNETLEALAETGLVTECAGNPTTYQPARSLSRVTMKDVLDTLRNCGKEPSALRDEPAFKSFLETIQEGDASMQQTTLEDAVRDHGHVLLSHVADVDEDDLPTAESA